ncbi:MAG: glycosyltransferase family 61 protein [Acidisphaera sp.]|nr:glycosyltransferase family 61 protein [Acidisphaera sp.]
MAVDPQRYAFTDPLDLPRITLDDLRTGAADGVLLEGADAPRRFPRPAPEYHDDPDGAGLFAGFADGLVTYPPAFLTSSWASRLVGYRMTLSRDALCFQDAGLEPETRARALDRLAREDDFSNEETGLRPTGQPGLFHFNAGARAQRHLPGSVVVLCSDEPYNFGSFLFRVLPKLHAVRRYGLGHLPLLVHAHAATQQQYLALLGAQREALVLHDTRTIYTIDHAIRPCLRNDQAYLDDETRALFTELRDRYGSRDHGARIYVSRLSHSKGGASSRAMLNEAALVERLRAQGFRIVEPERLSAHQQIEVFSAAELVVGPAGAGMFNVAFCRPGTRVIDIESEPHWIHAHTCLFASCGLRYAIFEGKVDPSDGRPVHRSWTVNIDALCDRIAGFCGDPPARAGRAKAMLRSGTLDEVTLTHARGWARDAAGTAPAEIEIVVEGARVGRVRAELPRDDLGALGPCAFVFRFPEPLVPTTAGLAVAARFADTGADLVHSPHRLAHP